MTYVLRKNIKFTIPYTFRAELRRCGEAQGEATHLCDLVPLSLVYTVFVSKAPICAFTYIRVAS